MASDKVKLPLEARGVEAEWVLTGDGDVGLLRTKVRYAGACLARVIHGLTAGSRACGVEEKTVRCSQGLKRQR